MSTVQTPTFNKTAFIAFFLSLIALVSILILCAIPEILSLGKGLIKDTTMLPMDALINGGGWWLGLGIIVGGLLKLQLRYATYVYDFDGISNNHSNFINFYYLV